MIRVGDYDIETFITEHFRLDGGAMFGMVPRGIWERSITPDAKHRIPMVARVMRLTSKDRSILIDVGCGPPKNDKEKEIYAIEPTDRAGVASFRPGLTDVILTHLHFDHGGGVATKTPAGELELSFPDATHHLQAAHWTYAQDPHVREKGAFPDTVIACLRQAKLNLIETQSGQEVELFPGVSVLQSDGHTLGMLGVIIRDGKQTVAFPIDLLPTAHHLPVHYGMGYDQCAKTLTDEKELFLAQAEAGNWIVVFCHDADTPAATITRDKHGRFAVKEKITALGS